MTTLMLITMISTTTLMTIFDDDDENDDNDDDDDELDEDLDEDDDVLVGYLLFLVRCCDDLKSFESLTEIKFDSPFCLLHKILLKIY